jgi:hypothetical protein
MWNNGGIILPMKILKIPMDFTNSFSVSSTYLHIISASSLPSRCAVISAQDAGLSYTI